MRFTRVTRVYNRTSMDLQLRAFVCVLSNPIRSIAIRSRQTEELRCRDYDLRRFNPEMVPSIFIYDGSNMDRPLIDEPISADILRRFKDIVITQIDGVFSIQKFERSLKNQFREYFWS